MEILEVNKLIKDKNEYNQIILNNFNKLISTIGNKKYILIKEIKQKDIECMIRNKHIVIGKNILDHSNWELLWSKKIDNIEYQLRHVENKYKILAKSINYYIGMAENAIEYIKNIEKNNFIYVNKYISHIRIKSKNTNNPQNIIVDYISRDIAEYLKFLFFSNQYCTEKTEQTLKMNNLTIIELELIFGRMLFPTFYFDKYDKILNEKIEEKEIETIINQSDEYEEYLKDIYYIINTKMQKKIPSITWI